MHSAQPHNAEPPLQRLRAAMVTPQADFYVRSHGNVPALQESVHRLRVCGRVANTLDLSVPELRQRFPACSVTAVMQCAGNRRADLQLCAPPPATPGRQLLSATPSGRVWPWPLCCRDWTQAELEHDAACPWSWTFWSATVDLPRGEHELVVRAWDSAGQTQPALPDDTWNFKGYLSAVWHRVLVFAS